MIKNKVKNIFLFILFVLGIIITLSAFSYVLRQKEYGGAQDKFKELEKNSIDTVFIGTSHQFCSINTDLLYDEFGIESFMLATSAQTIPMSYYAAMEAIEFQHPERIVLEMCYASNDFRTVTDEMSHCFFDGMPLCRAWSEGIKDLIDKESRIYFYLPLGLYHTRWKELKEADFINTAVSDRGSVYYENVVVNDEIPVIDKTQKEAMPQEMEKYMDMLIELCRKNDVELILYTAPFNTLHSEDEFDLNDLYRRQRIFNYISDYAENEGIEYHNLFYEIDNIGLDNSCDWMDRQHLNCSGQAKFTRYMANMGYIR